jgi:LacI family transcriptional regulator
LLEAGFKMGKTIHDVAVLAGVSTATVSRVLASSGEQVAEATKIRVLNAAGQLGYRVNYAARSLKTRSTMTIAVLAPELANDFFMEVAEGIERELDRRGYTMLLASSSNSVEEEKKRISMMTNRMVDGMVVIPAGARGDHLQAVSDQGMPMVLVDRIVEGADLDAVISDNEGGAFELTRTLLADGFKRISFVGGDITLSSARERLSGFARALAEAGIKPEPDWICLGGMEVEDGFKQMKAILARKELPQAMVAVNLLVHLGMERCLLGMDGPSSPVIAGFDESGYTPFLPACRYIAAQDAVGIGKQAGIRLIRRIHEKKFGSAAEENPEGEPHGAGLRRGTSGNRIIRLPVTIKRH